MSSPQFGFELRAVFCPEANLQVRAIPKSAYLCNCLLDDTIMAQ